MYISYRQNPIPTDWRPRGLWCLLWHVPPHQRLLWSLEVAMAPRVTLWYAEWWKLLWRAATHPISYLPLYFPHHIMVILVDSLKWGIPVFFIFMSFNSVCLLFLSFKCGRSFDPNFLFLWPNARVSLLAPSHSGALAQEDEVDTHFHNKWVLVADLVNVFNDSTAEVFGAIEPDRISALLTFFAFRLEKESSAFFATARLWDDGVILPEDTRKVMQWFGLFPT